MVKTKVKIDSVLDAKQFVGICNSVDFDVELVAIPYVIDAKSIMGIFSLDLTKPIDLRANCDDSDEFVEKISSFVVQ